MKWFYAVVKIKNKYHICEIYCDEDGKPAEKPLYSIEDRNFSIVGTKIPQWILKDLFENHLKL